jgi:hypothetical protein
LRDRAVAVLRDAVDAAGLQLATLPAAAFPAELLDAVRAHRPGLPHPLGGDGTTSDGVIPLPFPVWSVGGKLDEPVQACGGCR